MPVYNTRRAARIRLARLERLREIEAPLWVIKWEQAQLAGYRARKRNQTFMLALYERHVFPRMESRVQ